jgi:hypothetical protein
VAVVNIAFQPKPPVNAKCRITLESERNAEKTAGDNSEIGVTSEHALQLYQSLVNGGLARPRTALLKLERDRLFALLEQICA